MRGRQRTPGVATAFICLAAAAPVGAQTAPGAPQIYDADDRLIGIALSADPFFGRGRALLNFGDDQTVIHINRQGFLVGGPVPAGAGSQPTGYRDGVFFASGDCQGEPYLPVSSFPNYGLFIPDGSPEPGRSQAGTVVYASRPYATVVLRGKKTEDDVCFDLPAPVKSLVGVAARKRLPSYQLPFITK